MITSLALDYIAFIFYITHLRTRVIFQVGLALTPVNRLIGNYMSIQFNWSATRILDIKSKSIFSAQAYHNVYVLALYHINVGNFTRLIYHALCNNIQTAYRVRYLE